MAFTLNIQFGGLCLFVQRYKDGDPGLFVLMPATHGHHGGGKVPEHCRLLIAEGKYVSSGKDVVSALPRLVPWMDATNPGARVAQPDGALEFSKFTKRAVNSACFEATLPASVGTRIELPLGTMLESDTPMGELDVPGHGPQAVTGQVTASVAVTKYTTLTIGSHILVPVDGEISIRMVNVPATELAHKRRPYKRHSKATHVDAYFPFFTDDFHSGSFGITHSHEHNPNGAEPDPMPCPSTDTEHMLTASTFAELNVLGVDPNNCTTGGGCSTYPC
jgi:hypothetical protein